MFKSIIIFVVCLLETIKVCYSLKNCPQNERNALVAFKQGFIDPTNRLSTWDGQDCCKWEGITCNNFTGHVVKLDIRNPFPLDLDRLDYDSRDKTYSEACLTLVGELNSSLLELKHLNYLDLSWNNFSGKAIPKFIGLFHELTYLNLSSALFGGIVPHHLGNLTALRSLDLGTHYIPSYNYNSTIPSLVVDTLDWSWSLFSLQHLVMSRIDLSNIPSHSFSHAISMFPSIMELRFSSCSLQEISHLLQSVPPQNLTSLTILDLSINFFQGPIPSVIRNMTSLKVLNLNSNYFSSNDRPILDELKNLHKLEVLELSNNMFAGKMIESRFPNFSSPSIGDNLETLKLSVNSLTGYLPTWLHQLKSNLKLLHLAYNSFQGEIPTSFGKLQSLKKLNLGFNNLSGGIPTFLTKLSSLQVIDLGGNFLTGPIPSSLGRMSALIEIDLYSNQLSGEIPMSLGKLSKLKRLILGSNQFHGVVSELHFARLSQLKILDLSMNSLLSIRVRSGWVPPFQLVRIQLGYCAVGPQFPEWFQTQTLLIYLNMFNAGISDSIPNWFQNLTSLILIGLSGNKISGFIPTDIGYGLSHLEFLDLSNNSINGNIPNSLCKMFSLQLLSLSNNHLSGVLPHCLGDLQQLYIMDFSSNNLSGTIQTSVFRQPLFLETLHLNNNNFHGEFPQSLQNCLRLSSIDLSDNNFSGEIPTWIGKRLYDLRILKLSSNNYNASLSPNLCHLNNLQVLDIAGNHLSGNIPPCFGNFNAMLFNQTNFSDFSYKENTLSQVIKGRVLEYTKNLRFVINMDLSSNNFVGQIPETLTNLSGLMGLNLSRNHLTGSIPKNIGQMKSLESLDISNNNLSGTIPQSISELSFLTSLNLSNNNLSGKIPSGNQLQTLNDDASIYDGNSELCGAPLIKKCSGDEPTQTPKYVDRDGDGDGDGFLTIWFYLGMVCGCVVGFWGFCGVLLFKKNWRYAYFRFLDDKIIGDRLFYTTTRRKVRGKRN